MEILEESIDIFLKDFCTKDTEGFFKFFNEIMFFEGKYEDVLNEGKIKNIISKAKITHKKTGGKVDAALEGALNKLKTEIIGQTREEITKNSFKISKLVKRAIIFGASWALNPAIAVIGAFVTRVAKEKLKNNEREKIIADLKRELEICEEKIKDADSDGNKEKKYQLMRIKNELNRSIERVRYPGTTHA